MQMRQRRDVAALDAKYTKVNAKAENDALRDDVALVVVGYCLSAWSHRLGVDNAASRRQTPLNGIISPSEEADHYAKQLEGTQKYINEQCR